MATQRDFHNRDGNILRARSVADGFVEVELDFVAARREDALLYAIAALYLAFRVELDVSYVFSSHTFRKVVVRAADLTPAVEQALARAVERVRARSGVLFGRADELFRGKPGTTVVTSTVPELARFSRAELEGQEFLAAVAADLA